MVITQVEYAPDTLPWPLPGLTRSDRVFWAAANRVVVGPHLLAPRAQASWSETEPRIALSGR